MAVRDNLGGSGGFGNMKVRGTYTLTNPVYSYVNSYVHSKFSMQSVPDHDKYPCIIYAATWGTAKPTSVAPPPNVHFNGAPDYITLSQYSGNGCQIVTATVVQYEPE